MMGALWTSIFTFRNDKDGWIRLMQRGMSKDFSWDRAALQYEQVFDWAVIDPPYA
jgi:starch synthase